MPRRLGLLVVSLLLFFVCFSIERSARAEDSPKKPVSYAWQTILVDGGAAMLALSSGAYVRDPRQAEALAITGVAGYVVGAPIVHLAHESPGKAGTSLALRVFAPILGAAVGFAAGYGFGYVVTNDKSGGEFVGFLGGGLGMLGGFGAAIAIDAGVLARETR